jgi:hypothetical protein
MLDKNRSSGRRSPRPTSDSQARSGKSVMQQQLANIEARLAILQTNDLTQLAGNGP